MLNRSNEKTKAILTVGEALQRINKELPVRSKFRLHIPAASHHLISIKRTKWRLREGYSSP